MPAPISDEQKTRDREALLDAAESLFYERGIQAVGMDDIRAAAGIALKRIYGLFATKEELIVAVLQRRDRRWRGSLTNYVEQREDPRERVLAIFDWLEQWFAEPDFRGCAWINAYGELGATSPAILAEVRSHKRAFHEQIAAWVATATDAPAEPVCLLAEGAIVTAAITGDTKAARRAREASKSLMR
ncbi:TetR/AcrR family transcriptional regulator [Mycolicibacterium aubagnense]|uniref:TetR family transcriptional regulator n=1 Tax=Mycolicibacterium aubagnense TaxID=319707 RepID=A0ABM7IBF9_9MYCO|nr:TetR/AcrR family transcriptional regulator [Mycolicibacterium aubagnense]TLH57667.1 TetR/AcrR family transcriptional regulator [Mycolicibacterium aubagnense]WGI34147.1 TetR/AcrR family transcriptional regulator [Mycolicibacterium aubagnense]BBX84049.1 TetR family transcriptional regulator [Mycolicibacterium aubagnense]